MPPVRPSYRLLSAPYTGRRKGAGMVGLLRNTPKPAISSWVRRLVQTQSLPASPPRHEKVNDIRAYSSALDVQLVDNMLDVEMSEDAGTEPTTACGTPTAGYENGGDTEVETDGQSDSSMGSSDTSKASDWSPPHLVMMMKGLTPRPDQDADAETVTTERDCDRRSPTPEPDEADSNFAPLPEGMRTPSPEPVVPPDAASPDQFNDIMRNAPGGGRARAEYFRLENLRRHPSLVNTEVDDDEAPN